MRRALILLLVLSSSPAAEADEPCRGHEFALDGEATPKAACDGADIEIARACHCRPRREDARPWGPSEVLRLEMARTARVVSGERVDIPFTLRYEGAAPAELDFLGGEVVYETDTWKGKKKVESAPCAELNVRPDVITLTLRPGAVVRGTTSWKASTSQLDSCRDLARRLAPGRYRVELATVSGEPRLTASVEVTVVRAR